MNNMIVTKGAAVYEYVLSGNIVLNAFVYIHSFNPDPILVM